MLLVLDGKGGAEQKTRDRRGRVEVAAGVLERALVALLVIRVDLAQRVGLGEDDGRRELGLVVESMDGHLPAPTAFLKILVGQDGLE